MFLLELRSLFILGSFGMEWMCTRKLEDYKKLFG